MSDSATDRPPVRIWRRVFAALLIFIVCTVVFVYFTGTRQQERARRLIAEAEEALDRDDPHWRRFDLEAQREAVPDAENSAPVILFASRAIPKGWPEPALGRFLDDRTRHPLLQLDAGQIALLEKNLPHAAPSLFHARKVADMPHGRHRLTLTENPLATLLPDQSEVRAAVNVLLCEGLMLAQKGDIDGALRCCRASINTGRSLGDESLSISQLIRIACINTGCNLAERALAQGEASEKELAKLQELLELEDGHQTFRLMARGERAANYDLLGQLASGKVNSSNLYDLLNIAGEPFFARWTMKRVTYRDQLESLKLHNELVAATFLPEGDQAVELRRIDDELKKQRPSGKVWVVLAPAYVKLAEACRRKTEQVRTLLLLVAAERYRLKNDRWPLKLEDLVPNYLKTIPTDPYDGKPLRLVHRVDGVTVYSVGHDGRDDGGKIDRMRSNASGFDQGYELWNVKERRKPAAPLAVGQQ